MEDIINRLRKIAELEDDSEIEEIADELEEETEDMILNIYSFKRELQRQGLYTDELEEFIYNYMRYDNK